MIGPVSGTGRAMMASLQQAIDKGMPPDQAVQYVKSMATQGVAPLADLYAMMNQFQRLKQPQAQAPQTPPTIKDQLNILDQQQQMQQMQQQQAVPMDRGLGGIDAGLMQYPQFAGGGIVAFDDGGTADSAEIQRILRKSPMMRTPEENQLLREAGVETESRKLGEDSGVAGLNRFLKSPFIREAFGSPYASEEEIAQGGGAALNERILRGLGASQVTPQAPPAPAPAPTQAAVPTTAVSPFSSFGNMMSAGRTDPFGRPVSQDLVAAPPAPPRSERGTGAGGVAIGQIKRPTAEAPKESSEYLKEIQALRESQGLGKTRKERMEYLTKTEQELAKEYGADRMLAFAEAGFRMAGAASRPGATFLGALAEGAMSGTQALRALNKEQRANKRVMQDAMFQLKEAEEAEKEGDIKTALNMRENAKAIFADAQKLDLQINKDITLMNMQLRGSKEIEQIRASSRGEDDGMKGRKFDLEIIEKLLEDARERLLYAPDKDKPQIQAEIRGYLQQMRGLGTSGASIPVTTSGW